MLYKEYPGFVYIVDFKERGFKIGRTSNLVTRVRDFATFADTILIHSIKTNLSTRLEKFLHNKYGYKRKKGPGELFELSEEDIRYLKSVICVTYLTDAKHVAMTHIKHLISYGYYDNNYVEEYEKELSQKQFDYIKFYSHCFDNYPFNHQYRITIRNLLKENE